jgi:trigger factor
VDNDKPKLNIQREDVAPCRVKLTVELPAERVEKVYNASLLTFNRQAPVKGFRPGKIPRKLLLRRFGDDIANHTKGDLLQAGVEEAIEQEGLEPETRPVVEDEKDLRVLPGESFVFSVAFDVPPTFELPEYKGIAVSRDASAISEDSVAEWIDGWLQRQAQYAKVDRPAAEGDLLKASYKAQLPEGAEEPPATAKFYIDAEDTWLPLRDPELLPGAAALLVGCEAGTEKDVEITFPEDHGEESLAGRTLTYHISISEVHGLEKPELDDDLAQKAGLETADEIRERVRENLDAEKKQEQDRAVREQVLRALTADADFALPPTILSRTVGSAMQRLREQEMRAGTSPEDLQKNHEQLVERANEQAREELVRFYMLGRIADLEDIKVEASDLDQAVQMFAQMEQATPKVVLRRLRDSGRLNQLLLNLRESKTIDRLIELAEVAEVDGAEE